MINQPFLDNQSSSRSGITTFEVSKEHFEGPWINGSLISEKRTDWQTRRDGLVMEPQVRFWIGGRDDVEEKSQELAAVKKNALWGNWSLDTIQGKRNAVEEASIYGESHIALQGLNSRKLDEVEEITAQSDYIPNTKLGKGYRAKEKSANKKGSNISNETSDWYLNDEKEIWVE
ncbi:hypothetical protein EAF04_004350 [Stromatinia cepivora]|nr:hypothetical protein EAF04_004350 [Stromatinia cepivora]